MNPVSGARPTSSVPAAPATGAAPFLTTHWSLVRAAGADDTARSGEALAALCHTYWPPLYTYLRRRGYTVQDAEDLTQGFFARLLERKDVAVVRPEKGKFRSYLLGAMNHYLSDQRDKARAQKRGGGNVLSLDFDAAESAYRFHAADEGATPDQLYDRQWVVTLLEEVQRRLRQAHRQEGKEAWYEALRFTLTGEQPHPSYAELAPQLGATEGAVKVAAHRLRRRYRVLLRELIAETVSPPEEVEDELRHLLRALARRPRP